MSNRRKLVSPAALALRRLDGTRKPGGCSACDAIFEVTAPAYGEANFAEMRVYHDDDCRRHPRTVRPAR